VCQTVDGCQCSLTLGRRARTLGKAFQGIQASAAIVGCSRRRLARDMATAVGVHAGEDSRGFDWLSERTTFICAPTPLARCSKSASYLGYSGRGGNAFGKAARDPNRKSKFAICDGS
jgi:hypothetical protein